MLVYHNDLKESLALARQHSMDLIQQGLEPFYSFENRLEYLRTGGNWSDGTDSIRCHLYYDFAPFSFGWTWYKRDDTNGMTANDDICRLHKELIGYRRIMNGGLIYHRDYTDNSKGQWSIHT